MHNPKLVKASAPLGAYFHPGGYSLSEREREIAVIIINSKWHSAYPTNAHERRGKEVGLPPEKVEAMLSGMPTSFADEREQIVYEMAICLGNSRWVSKGLYDRAVKALGRVGITDVITLMGYFTSANAIGKDFLPEGALFAKAPSGSGFQVSFYGLAGILLAAEEGLEVNVLGLNVGLDAAVPALKLPAIGRLGLDR